ncbi:MAG: AbrB/MazE/SpoVT family DNA-binding domain-containing protein [bacterium]
MLLVKIGPKHQVTIPKEIFEALQLEVGDILKVTIQDGKGVIIPKRIAEKAPAPKLSSKEQQFLKTAQQKISAIQNNLISAKGLTEGEVNVAVKVGLIDAGQRWWWSEEWQRGEREAQRDIEEGRVEEFENVEALLKALRT